MIQLLAALAPSIVSLFTSDKKDLNTAKKVAAVVDKAGKVFEIENPTKDKVLAHIEKNINDPEFQVKLKEFERDAKALQEAMDLEHQRLFNERVNDYEGTTAEIKDIWIIGPLLIFIRSAIRPAWSIFTLYADTMVYKGEWVIVADSWTEITFFVNNIIVIGFWFGERVVKNTLPLVLQMLEARGYIKPEGKQ